MQKLIKQKSILEIKLYFKKRKPKEAKISKPKGLLVGDILVPNLESEVKKAYFQKEGQMLKATPCHDRETPHSLAWPAQRQKMFQLLLFCLV